MKITRDLYLKRAEPQDGGYALVTMTDEREARTIGTYDPTHLEISMSLGYAVVIMRDPLQPITVTIEFGEES